MRRRDLPIMVGSGMRKGIMAVRGDTRRGGFDLWIVWLRRDYASGESYELGDIENVQAVLHFCDRQSVERTKEALEWILATWKEVK